MIKDSMRAGKEESINNKSQFFDLLFKSTILDKITLGENVGKKDRQVVGLPGKRRGIRAEL